MNASRRTVLATVGSTGVVGSLLLGSDPRPRVSASGTAPRIEPIFSYPSALGVPDGVHEETVVDLLSRAVPGTPVHLTTYTLTRIPVAKACITAAARGVLVNVMIDEHYADADATRLLLSELGERVSITVGGAIGDGINHNKFLLVRELANGESNVVWQSSSNFTNTQRYRHNTSVVFRGDRDLYEAYLSYWNDLADGETDRHYNRTEETDSATVYFSPRSDFDTHLEALSRVSPTPDATIRFVNSIWTTERIAIVDRVDELVDRGCTVEVILNEAESTVGTHLRRAGATVLEYPSTTLRGRLTPGQEPNVHAKTMLVDADVDVDGEVDRRRLVYTGSQNLSGYGLHNNDETLLRIEDDEVYCKFVRDWKRVRDQGSALSRGEFPSVSWPRRRGASRSTEC